MKLERLVCLVVSLAAALLACGRSRSDGGRSTAAQGSATTSAAPTVGYERELGVPDIHLRYNPVAAGDGAGYLVAWAEAGISGDDLRAARVAPDGTVLDAGGFLVGSGAGRQAIAFDGSSYWLAWTSWMGDEGSIQVARVSPDGLVLDAPPMTVATFPPNRAYGRPAIACTTGACLVTWRYDRLYGARFSTSGAILDPGGFAFPGASAEWQAGASPDPAIAQDGAGFLVVWPEAADVRAARVTADGAILDATSLAFAVTPEEESYLAADFSGGEYLVAWCGYDAAQGTMRIRAGRVSGAGVPLDASPLELSGPYQTYTYPSVSVTHGPDGFRVAWSLMRKTDGVGEVWEGGVDPAGNVLQPDRIAEHMDMPFVAANGEERLFALRSQGDWIVRGAQVSGPLSAAPSSFAISGPALPAGAQAHPAVASPARGQFVVAWEDQRSGNWDLSATMFPGMDSSRFAVAGGAGDQVHASLATGAGFQGIAAWEDRSGADADVVAVPLELGNGAPGLSPVRIGSGPGDQLSPRAVRIGAGYLVVWEDRGAGRVSVRGAVVDPAGQVAKPAFLIASADSSSAAPAVAGDGQEALVVWEDGRGPGIFAARIGADGAVLDPGGFPLGTGEASRAPAVARLGSTYLVVWADGDAGESDIHARRVGADGAVQDGTDRIVAAAAGPQRAPAVVAEGRGFLVAWEDGRSGAAFDLRGALLGPSGELLQPELVLSSDGNDHRAAQLASDGAGQSFLVYERYAPGRHAYQVYGRQVTTWTPAALAVYVDGPGRVESTPAGIDCASGSSSGCVASPGYPMGEPVTLVATPEPGQVFVEWQGGCSGGSPVCELMLQGDTSVLAVFDRPASLLTVTRSGLGSGRVVSRWPGIDCGDVCSAPFSVRSSVELQAIPDVGSRFAGWSGDCTGAGGCLVSMDRPHDVKAVFDPFLVPLWVARASGGTVVSIPAGIDCGGVCTASFPQGSTVTLTAVPVPGSVFDRWTGACSGTTPVCQIQLQDPPKVPAQPAFVPAAHVRIDPAPVYGVVSTPSSQISCTAGSSQPVDVSGACEADVPSGRELQLTATADPGFSFSRWTGACAGSGATCRLTPGAGAKLTTSPIFLYGFPLTVSISGSGSVRAVYGSTTQTCASGTCTFAVPPGSRVTLSPTSGTFLGWSGACSGKLSSCSVTMDAARSVAAQFASVYVLSTGHGGPGSIASSPAGISNSYPSASFATGTRVTLTAVPVPGSQFLGWSGDCTGALPTCVVTMDRARSVFARFDASVAELNVRRGIQAGGTVTSSPAGIDCGSTCDYAFPLGTVVTLSVTPAPGYVFTGWSGGACTGSDPVCTATMSAQRGTIAYFAAAPSGS